MTSCSTGEDIFHTHRRQRLSIQQLERRLRNQEGKKIGKWARDVNRDFPEEETQMTMAMKRCSASLRSGEMHVETQGDTMHSHSILKSKNCDTTK